MISIRQGLRDGKLRIQLAVWLPTLCGVTGFIIISYTGFSVIAYWPNTPGILKLVAGLSAILSVSSYNLRIKALDYSIKLIEQGFSPKRAKENMERTSCILTNLVLLSFVTSIVLFFSTKTVLSVVVWGNIVLCIGCSLLLSCCVQYVYVLFAFEKLEETIMRDKCAQKYQEQDKVYADHRKDLKNQPDTKTPKRWS